MAGVAPLACVAAIHASIETTILCAEASPDKVECSTQKQNNTRQTLAKRLHFASGCKLGLRNVQSQTYCEAQKRHHQGGALTPESTTRSKNKPGQALTGQD
jgi:hypothetical protein